MKMIPITDLVQNPAYLIGKGKIYTSHWHMVSALTTHGIVPISIVSNTPMFFHGIEFPHLPQEGQFKPHSRNNFTIEYKGALQEYNVYDTVCDLYALSLGKPFALCSYEKPDEFGRRNVLTDWLRSYRFEVEEFNPPKFFKPEEPTRPTKRPPGEQLTLF